MLALKPSPRAALSFTSSPPSPFRTVRSVFRDARRATCKTPFAHPDFAFISHFDIRFSAFILPPSSFPTPPSALRIRNVRLFEKTYLIEHFRGPPYKARSKITIFSNNEPKNRQLLDRPTTSHHNHQRHEVVQTMSHDRHQQVIKVQKQPAQIDTENTSTNVLTFKSFSLPECQSTKHPSEIREVLVVPIRVVPPPMNE